MSLWGSLWITTATSLPPDLHRTPELRSARNFARPPGAWLDRRRVFDRETALVFSTARPVERRFGAAFSAKKRWALAPDVKVFTTRKVISETTSSEKPCLPPAWPESFPSASAGFPVSLPFAACMQSHRDWLC
jgi:hypothetical protein